MCLHTPEVLDVNVQVGKMACTHVLLPIKRRADLPLEMLDTSTQYGLPWQRPLLASIFASTYPYTG